MNTLPEKISEEPVVIEEEAHERHLEDFVDDIEPGKASKLLFWGILNAIGATLTLPGIAGMILTLGMAVDANVIIFERIKEELIDNKLYLTAGMPATVFIRTKPRTVLDYLIEPMMANFDRALREN